MTPDEILARLEAPLSLRRRLGYLAVLLAGLGGALLTGTLWATEPALPGRTAAAFGLLTTVGLGWAGYGGWALTRRAPLYARDRVIAAWIALAAWLAGGAGVAALAATRGSFPAGMAVVVAVLGAAAAVNLVVAHRRRAALRRLRG
ncbi:CHASE2 domain-containing sensor protein [Actinoplanes tereljensis]|uniref:Transmembrane transport protein n=1 Tax=Paractinoplanes tereljensis TaxID=571912 RepID=A0A919NUJ3_9ACTN|nr:hypothetical protein [Actinoplanes tereljensis]GIF25494.1 hypothetical protein Ate02nite_82240 [Actinoplanes tereljensis]